MTNTTLRELLAFLCGSAPLDGVWFGDKHPTERGQFWWRKHMLATVEPLLDAADERDALRARLDAAPVADVRSSSDYVASLDGESVSDDDAIRALIGGPQVRVVVIPAPPVAGGGEQSTEGETK